MPSTNQADICRLTTELHQSSLKAASAAISGNDEALLNHSAELLRALKSILNGRQQCFAAALALAFDIGPHGETPPGGLHDPRFDRWACAGD